MGEVAGSSPVSSTIDHSELRLFFYEKRSLRIRKDLFVFCQIKSLSFFCEDPVQDDSRQGDDPESEEETDFPFQDIDQVVYKIDRCKSHVILLHKEAHDQSARDDGSDLTGDVDTHRVHQQEVLIVFLKSHLVDDASGHREGGNSGCPDHRIDLLLQEEV